ARYELAMYLLQAGDSLSAAAEAKKLREWLPISGLALSSDFERDVIRLQAIASLRMGEQQNCLKNHNAQSCVYPIQGGGVHRDRTGAQAAAELWTSLMLQGRATLIDR